MPDKNRIEVEILGHKYTIRSDAAPEYVRELAAHVEQRAREIQSPGPSQDPVKLLALAALYITDELVRLRDEHSLADKDTSARLGALIQLLVAVAPAGSRCSSPYALLPPILLDDMTRRAAPSACPAL